MNKLKKTAVKTVVKTAAGAGILVTLGIFFRKIFIGKEVNAQIQLKAADLNQTRNKLQKMTESLRKEVINSEHSLKARQMAAAMLDCADSNTRLLDMIKVDAGIFKNGYTTSKFSIFINALLSRSVSLVISIAAFIAIIMLKLELPSDISAEIMGIVNTAMLLSGIAMLHCLCGIVVNTVSQNRQDAKGITVEVTASIPDDEQDLFVQRQEQNLRQACLAAYNQIDSIKQMDMDNDSLMAIVDIYQYIFQAHVLDDNSNIGGYIIPEYSKMLERMGIVSVPKYNEKTAYMFNVLDAPDAGSSFVLKPAIILKDKETIVCYGEYVKGL